MERYPTLRAVALPGDEVATDTPDPRPAFVDSGSAALHQAAAAGDPGAKAARAGATIERTIGDIIRENRQLTPEQVERVLEHQRQHGVRFGEAAVALKLASSDDVLWALSQQFHYPFMSREQRKLLNPELVAARHPFSSPSELVRSLRSQIVKRLSAIGQRAAVAVVSPASGDGKTYFAANLAISFSQLRRNTLLIDADLRNPRLHELFGAQPGAGLTNTLTGRNGQVIRPVAQLPNLYLLPAGTLPPNPLELVDSPTFGLLMRRVLERFDHVVVDTPAASHGADASVIAGQCGTALAIARQGHSRVSGLQDFVSQLRDDGTQVLGMLVNQY